MRIHSIQSFHADGGWRPFSFLKLATDEGLVGWSEYAVGPWAPALPLVIEELGQSVIGRDPRDFAVLRRELSASTRFAAGGLNTQAIAALENACIDLAAKSVRQPVWQYFGGRFREAIDLYWSHCGSFRARDPKLFERLVGSEPLKDLESIRRLGSEIAQRGFRAAKTNPIRFANGQAELLNPGFVPKGMDHAGVIDPDVASAIAAQMEAFRDGAGPAIDLMLDVNFAYSPQSVARLEREVRKYGLRWLEFDHHVAAGLARLRKSIATPLASLETVYGAVSYKSYLDAGAVDLAVVDILWNGFSDSLGIAQQCDLHAVNVAPHNFYGPMADLIAANFCAVVPNVEIMEIEADDVPWKYKFLTHAPKIEGGRMQIPAGIGWGADLNEDALQEHAWRPAS